MRGYEEVAIEDEATGFGAYLVVEATEKPLSFGGTRVDLAVTRDVVVDLADNMALKLAGHGSPVGGAKAGLRVSPDDPRLKAFLLRFADECRELLTSTTILGKDMGAKQWMLDEVYASLGIPQLGLARRQCTSSTMPDHLSDLDGYIPHMTGQGVFWSIEQALGGDVHGARVLVQGFGVVGSGVAWHLARAGASVVGVSDREKAVVHSRGLDVAGLLAAKRDDGIVAPARLGKRCVVTGREDLLAASADVLVLAAGSYLVDGDLAARIRTPVVFEAANLALTPAARRVLHEHGARVVPDVVANSASAALVAHQIASGNTLLPRLLWAQIETNIKRGTEEVDRVSKELGIDSKAAFRHVVEPRD